MVLGQMVEYVLPAYSVLELEKTFRTKRERTYIVPEAADFRLARLIDESVAARPFVKMAAARRGAPREIQRAGFDIV